MMATPHILAGAVVSRLLRRPWLAWPAAFACHFLLDATPHLDAHGLFGGPEGERTTVEGVVAVADFCVGAALVTWLVWRHPDRRLVLVGGLCGILIDLLEYATPLGPLMRRWVGTSWMIYGHHAIQQNVARHLWPLGLATQGVLVTAGVWFLRTFPRLPCRATGALACLDSGRNGKDNNGGLEAQGGTCPVSRR